MIKVYGYARKSPDDKEDTETSIENQVKLIERICKEKEWTLIKPFIDKNLSGGDRFRKGFTDMVSSAVANSIPIIIVKEQDRFARDSSFFVDTLTDLDARGIKVFSIIKNNFLSAEDLGDVVTSVVDAHYIITQRKKTRVLQDQKMNDGLPSIRAPFGYKYNKKGEWVINDKKAEIVREVELDRKNGVNYKDTIQRLKINKPLYYRIIRGIENGIYSGFVVYERKIRDSNKKIVKTEEIKYKGLHEAIIPLDSGINILIDKKLKDEKNN